MTIASKYSTKFTGKSVELKIEYSGGTYYLYVDRVVKKYSSDESTIRREYDSY